MAANSAGPVKTAGWINLLLGLWLAGSPWIFGAPSGAGVWSSTPRQ
jgi:hypothetical protein